MELDLPTHPDAVLAVLDRNAAENPRGVIGANNPPEPTPFEQSRDEIDDLFMEAKNFLDGEPITTQAVADAVGQLLDKLRQAEKRADGRRKAEAQPFDDGKAEVQARYNPLIQAGKGKTALAIETCKKALQPFVDAKAAAQRAIAEAARQEAEAKRKAAEDALRASQADDLAQRMEAERLLREAKHAETNAKQAEAARPTVAGGARAITGRSTWVATLTDRRAAMRHLWGVCPEAFDDVLIRIGQDFAKAGTRELPGFSITEQRSVA